MYIRRLIYTPAGNIMISILLGLGLATLFRKSCKNRNCLVFQAPPIDKIKNQVFKFDGKCYTFDEKAEKCDSNKKIIKF
jgi:hypothetical protein